MDMIVLILVNLVLTYFAHAHKDSNLIDFYHTLLKYLFNASYYWQFSSDWKIKNYKINSSSARPERSYAWVNKFWIWIFRGKLSLVRYYTWFLSLAEYLFDLTEIKFGFEAIRINVFCPVLFNSKTERYFKINFMKKMKM